MNFLELLSLLYSLSYFLIRGMLSILISYIVGDSTNVAQIMSLSSIFNLSYSVFQSFNGYFIDRFGVKIIALISIFSGFILILIYLNFPSYILKYILISALGIGFSLATLNITFVVRSSSVLLGFIRLTMNVLSGFFLSIFIRNFKIQTNILILSLMLIICGVSISFARLRSKKRIEKVALIKNIQNIDFYFFLLCINGILGSLPYFVFNSGLGNVLYNDSKATLFIATQLTYGFAFGNLFVIANQYFDDRKIVVLISLLQVLALKNLMNCKFSFFLIGSSYACHLVPITYITKKYKNPIFVAGFYNFCIMFFSSFVGLKILSKYIEKIQEKSSLNNDLSLYSQEKYFILKILFLISLFNLFFSIILNFTKKKK